MSQDYSVSDDHGPTKKSGLVVGAVVFLLLLVLPAPAALSPAAWRTAAVAALMAIWWMTEAIPIPATALLPLALFPLLGVLDMPGTAAPYANHIIFLFMGGFLLGVAMERWGLHKRLALTIVILVGSSPRRLVLGFMLATAILSMWISNTATAVMMLPVALAVTRMLRPTDLEAGATFHFGIALMLGIAYAASIGGVATLIGTPPNAVMAAAAEELLGRPVGFVEWMGVGLPLVAAMLPVTWILLVTVLHPPGELAGDSERILREERRALGPVGRGEQIVGIVFGLTALAWVMRAPKTIGAVTLPGIQSVAPWVQDSTIAMAAAALLFLIPVSWRRGEFALDWETARKIPWGILILFGGGLSLARAMDESGLAAWIGGAVVALGGLPTVILVGAAAALFVFLTEITSNTATSTMAMPVMVGAATALGMDPLILMATAATAASMAFMLPVATPPNAIVFGSDYLTIPQMARAGFWLNLLAIALISLAGAVLVPLFVLG